jgi:hypothetical protein
LYCSEISVRFDTRSAATGIMGIQVIEFGVRVDTRLAATGIMDVQVI